MGSWRVGVTRGLRWDIVADATHNANWLWHDRFTWRLVCSQILHIVVLRQRPVASLGACMSRLQSCLSIFGAGCFMLVLLVCWLEGVLTS